MCLAQAYASSGDLGSARSELERMLAANTRDTQLLAQLSKLAEEEGDIDSAARYQKQLVDLAPGDEGFSRLGQLYARSGDLEEAQGVWSKLAAGQGSALHVTMAMDSLLFHQKPMPVLETTEAMLRKDPHDWEALYRRGVAAAQLDRPDQAAQAFRTLLEVTISDDEKSALAKAQVRNPRLQPPNAYPLFSRQQGSSPMENRLGVVIYIRYFCRLDDSTIGQRYSWSPADFGQARLAAMGWMVGLAQRRGAAARGVRGLDPQAGREAAGRSSRLVGLALSVQHAPRLPRCLRGGPRAQPRGALRPARALGVPAQPGEPAHSGRSTGRHHPDRERGIQPAAARSGRARSRARVLRRPPIPASRAGPGGDPPVRRRRAEAGEAGRGGGAILPRARRRREPDRPGRRRAEHRGPSRGRRRARRAGRALRAPPGRPIRDRLQHRLVPLRRRPEHVDVARG